MTTNLSSRGLRTTLSIPGTGLSFSSRSGSSIRAQRAIAKENERVSRERLVAQNTHTTLKIQEDFEKAVSELLEFWRCQVPFFDRGDYESAAELRPFCSKIKPPKKFDPAKAAGPEPTKPTERSVAKTLQNEIESQILSAEPIPPVIYVLVPAIAFVFSLPVFLMVSWILISFPLFLVSMFFWCFVAYLAFKYLWLDQRRPDISRHVETNLRSSLETALLEFEKDKESYRVESKLRVERAEREYRQIVEDYECQVEVERTAWTEAEMERTKWARGILAGDSAIVSEAILASFAELTLPFDANLDAYVSDDGTTACLNLDLPEIEDVIEYSAIGCNKDGSAKYAKRDLNRRHHEYSQLTAGFIVLVICTVFSAAPTINDIIVGAYTQRGQSGKDTYVLQFKLNRSQRPSKDTVARMDACQFLGHYGVKVRVSNTGRLNPIPKPNWDELLASK